jgi:hypothetical protein
MLAAQDFQGAGPIYSSLYHDHSMVLLEIAFNPNHIDNSRPMTGCCVAFLMHECKDATWSGTKDQDRNVEPLAILLGVLHDEQDSI